MHEIHAPGLIAAARGRHGAPMQAEALLAAGPHPHLQALEAIESMHALLVVPPPFAPQQNPNALVAEAWAGLGQLPDPHPQRGRIAGP